MAWQFVEGAAHISPVSAENYICSDCCCWDQCTHTHTHTHTLNLRTQQCPKAQL